ncbi:hypothetical protein LPJ56_001806, partial [Coemansia sp. RSA 2599]
MAAAQPTDIAAAACAKGFQGLGDDEGCCYINELSPAELGTLMFVLFDPGHRDLLFGIHEDSEPDSLMSLWYTQNQCNVKRQLRHHTHLCQAIKLKHPLADVVFTAEEELSKNSPHTLDHAKFQAYVK